MRKTSYNSFQFAEGDPGNISAPADLLRYVRDFEHRAALAFNALAAMKLEPQYTAPDRPRDGMLYRARAPWNPGSGDGVYYYDDVSGYKFLG
jgi:hypothetical protein